MIKVNERMLGLGTQRSVIRELFEFGKLRATEVGAENVFDFSIGNPSVPAPEIVTETAKKMLDEMSPVVLHGYTSANGDLGVRTKVAESLNQRFHTNYTADNLYMTAGAAEGLCVCFNGLGNPGDEFIVVAPYFPEYKVFIEGAGCKMVLIDADIDAFQIDFAKLEAAITPNTKGIIVNSPNNPSGVIYSAETLKKLAELLKAKSEAYGSPIYIITDEPYREIVFEGSSVPFLPDFYDNTIMCYSWSKCLSLPGERLGYVLVPDTVEESKLVYAAIAGAGRSLGYVCAPSMFQFVCAECANETADISVYETNKNILMEGLTKLGYHVVEPNGTFYMFPRTLIEDDIAFCEKAKDFNLLIVPGTGFGCPGHVRISYCVQTDIVERSLEAFAKLAEYYKK